MDGFDATEGIIVIASTNRPDVLDPALMRPGRFDRQVYVSLPDVRGREAILGVHAEKVKMASDVELRIIARGTPGFSGADLRNLINEAALFAARSNRKEVTLAELEWARDKVMMGPERKSMVMSEDERKTTAYHEAGHALVSALLPNADPIHKVTIIPRGRALGVTAYLPENDNRSYDVEYLSNRITIAMGGRAAEEVIFDQLTTGASNDIQQATETVRNMICRWGMNNKFGPIVLGSDEQQSVMGQALGKEREYSEDTAEQIDTEMRDMVKSHYEQACQLLRDNLDTLHQIAHTLLEEETIEGSRIMDMLGKPQLPKVEISLN
jgi:cell division protease FtsH